MNELLSVHVSERDGCTRVAPVGEIDMSNAAMLRAALEDAQGTAGRIELYLAGVSFIDSTGLRLMLEADAAARSNGHSLEFLSPSKAVLRIFEVAGFSRLLDSAQGLVGTDP